MRSLTRKPPSGPTIWFAGDGWDLSTEPPATAQRHERPRRRDGPVTERGAGAAAAGPGDRALKRHLVAGAARAGDSPAAGAADPRSNAEADRDLPPPCCARAAPPAGAIAAKAAVTTPTSTDERTMARVRRDNPDDEDCLRHIRLYLARLAPLAYRAISCPFHGAGGLHAGSRAAGGIMQRVLLQRIAELHEDRAGAGQRSNRRGPERDGTQVERNDGDRFATTKRCRHFSRRRT